MAVLCNVNAQWTGTNPVTTTSTVGIGTTTPANSLHVVKSNITSPVFTADDIAIFEGTNALLKLHATALGGIDFASTTSRAKAYLRYDFTTNNFTFTNASGNAFTVLNSGFFGIGVATPTAKLDVNGSAKFVDGIRITKTGDGYLSFYNSTTAVGEIRGNGTTGLGFYSTVKGTHSLVANNNTGFIGLGTSTPDAKLHVKGGFLHLETGVAGVAGPSINFGSGNTDNAQLGQYGIEYIQGSGLNFWTPNGSETGMQNSILFLHKNGCVGIGTNLASNTNNYYKLSVNGSVRAKEVVVETGWADYVFADDYKLKSLDEVELYIKEHKTLPNIPSEQEIKKQNIGLGEQNRLQQEKIEELTLYAIQQQKQIDILLERLSKVETLIGR